MDTELEKLELLSWLQKLKDSVLIHKISLLKKEAEKVKEVKRKRGSGKHLVSYIADDFDEPLDHFKDYMPS